MFKPNKPQHVANKKYVDQLVDAVPKINAEIPEEDGTYVLVCTVVDGEASFSYEPNEPILDPELQGQPDNPGSV